jgi:hypothetical protein
MAVVADADPDRHAQAAAAGGTWIYE